ADASVLNRRALLPAADADRGAAADIGGAVGAATPVSLTNVSKLYGKQRAVDQVSLVLHPGECVVLAGHNGAGKSTLIKLILGLTRADGGQVHVLGHDAKS